MEAARTALSHRRLCQVCGAGFVGLAGRDYETAEVSTGTASTATLRSKSPPFFAKSATKGWGNPFRRLSYSLRRGAGGQRPDRTVCIPINIEHRGQSCHLEQLAYAIVQVCKSQMTTLVSNGGVSFDQLAQA